MNYVVLARKRWGDKCIPLTQVSGSENRAIALAQRVYKKCAMNRALVLDSNYNIVFKIDRRCKCLNVQLNLNGEWKCEDCGLVIPSNGVMEVLNEAEGS